MNKTIIYNTWPPLMKVTGGHIKALLEVDSNDTVKRKLLEWGITITNGYVLSEDILDRFKKPQYNASTIAPKYTASKTFDDLLDEETT